MWVLNLIFDNEGGKLHIALTVCSLAYMILPVLIQPVFLIIINIFGYNSKTIYRSEDKYFWLLTIALLISDAANFVVFFLTASGM